MVWSCLVTKIEAKNHNTYLIMKRSDPNLKSIVLNNTYLLHGAESFLRS
jgi:hypothetical protein